MVLEATALNVMAMATAPPANGADMLATKRASGSRVEDHLVAEADNARAVHAILFLRYVE